MLSNGRVHWINHLLLWSLQNSIYVSCIIGYINLALAGQIPIKVLSPPSSSLHRLQREDAETAPVLCTFCSNLQQHRDQASWCLAKTTFSGMLAKTTVSDMLAKTTVKVKGLLPGSANEAHVCSQQRGGTCKEQDRRREQDQELEQGTGGGNSGEREEREEDQWPTSLSSLLDHGWQDQDHEVASRKWLQVIEIWTFKNMLMRNKFTISQKQHIIILK